MPLLLRLASEVLLAVTVTIATQIVSHLMEEDRS